MRLIRKFVCRAILLTFIFMVIASCSPVKTITVTGDGGNCIQLKAIKKLIPKHIDEVYISKHTVNEMSCVGLYEYDLRSPRSGVVVKYCFLKFSNKIEAFNSDKADEVLKDFISQNGDLFTHEEKENITERFLKGPINYNAMGIGRDL